MTLVINPDIEIKDSPIQGKGLFAKVPIKKGTAIWICKGEEPYEEKVYTDEEFKKFTAWCIKNGKEWDAVAMAMERILPQYLTEKSTPATMATIAVTQILTRIVLH